jgi:hypothetical protein
MNADGLRPVPTVVRLQAYRAVASLFLPFFGVIRVLPGESKRQLRIVVPARIESEEAQHFLFGVLGRVLVVTRTRHIVDRARQKHSVPMWAMTHRVILMAAQAAKVRVKQTHIGSTREEWLRIQLDNALAGPLQRGKHRPCSGEELVQLECKERGVASSGSSGSTSFRRCGQKKKPTQSFFALQVGRTGRAL